MEREIIFRNASQYIESLGKQFRAVAPLSRQHLIKTPDPSCQHQGVAGEAEPVGFGGWGERALASMVAGCSFPIFTLISPKVNHLVPFVVFSFIIAVLLIYTHRKNIERLKAGTESKIYIWKPRHVKQQPPKPEKKEE